MPRGGTLSDLGIDFNPMEEIVEGLRRTEEQSDRTAQSLNRLERDIRNNASQTNAMVQALEGGFSRLIERIDGYLGALSRANNAHRQGRRETEELAASMEDAYRVYQKMGVDIRKLSVNLEELQFTESEINKVVKLGTEYELQGNANRISSYDALSQKYRAMKVLYDNMTESERQSNAQFVADLRATYEQMNLIQQASGKYQLQVGNYSKSMTGLNIATQQVIRELPTLANSATTFAIAISNNIPILVDNISMANRDRKAQEALRASLLAEAAAARSAGDALLAQSKMAEANAIKVTSVMRGLLKSLLSWQTAIVLVLTVLPSIIRNIEKKRKEQEELNKKTKEAVDFTKQYAAALTDINKDVVKETSDLRTLYAVATDVNRSMEDRIMAAQNIKKEYADAFKNYSDEEIALGKAVTSYDNLTKALERNAEMRAYLNKITELKQKEIEVKANRDVAQAAWDAAKETEALRKAEYDLLVQRREEAGPKGSAPYQSLTPLVENAQKALNAAKDASDLAHEAFMVPDNELMVLENEVAKLIDNMPISVFDLNDVDKKGKAFVQKTRDYFYEAVKSVISLMDGESLMPKLLTLDWGFAEQQDKRRADIKALEDQIKEAEKIRVSGSEKEKADAEKAIKEYQQQIEYLKTIMINAERAYNAEREKMIHEHLAQYREEVQEEGDIDEQEVKKIRARLLQVKAESDSIAYDAFRSGTITTKMLSDKLKENDEAFWRGFLKEIEDKGLLTQKLFNEIMSNLVKTADKNSDDWKKRRRTGRNLVSILLSYTDEYGEVASNGFHYLKDEYTEFANSVDAALKKSMKSMEEWIDTREKLAEIAVDAAKKETDSALDALKLEQEARANGYANNVELARKEYEQRLEIQRKAEEEQKRIARAQMAINTATQISELVTATAKIWSAEGVKGVLGVPLAILATSTMWASFAAAKVQAAKLANTQTYGEGMSEYLDYGGSHASGRDIDFGTTKDGKRRRVERGEMIGVINKKNVQKYGVDTITNIISSLNHGNFENSYGLAFAGLALGQGASSVDLSKLERGVDALVEQGGVRIVQTEHGRIEYRGHNKRIIRN